MANETVYPPGYFDRGNSKGNQVTVTTNTGTSKETIVSTMGPRGYKPKYGVTDSGNVIELYSGALIPTGGSTEVYNWGFVNISDEDMPFFLSSLGAYTGSTDAERIAWLQDQMIKMETLAKVYAGKIREISEGEKDLADAVASALVLVGGKLLVAFPPAGALVFGVGLLIKFLQSSNAKKILEFKLSKIKEWTAIIKTLQDQYILYNQEIESLQNKKKYTMIAIILGVIYLFTRKKK